MEENPVQNTTQAPNPIPVENPTSPPQSAQPPVEQLSNPSTPSMPESHENTNTRTLIAILLLIFAYPIGLIFMWVATKWPRWVKLILSAPVILAIIGIIIAFAVAFMGTSRNASRLSNSLQNTYQEVSPKPTIAVKTEGNRIVNDQGGYSFILPNPWKAKISSYSNTTTIFGESFLNDLGIGQIDVGTHDASLADALNHQTKGQYSQPTPITVNGVSGVIEDFKSVTQGKVVIVYKNGKTYGVSIFSNNPDDLNKFQEILSTFKFTQ